MRRVTKLKNGQPAKTFSFQTYVHVFLPPLNNFFSDYSIVTYINLLIITAAPNLYHCRGSNLDHLL